MSFYQAGRSKKNQQWENQTTAVHIKALFPPNGHHSQDTTQRNTLEVFYDVVDLSDPNSSALVTPRERKLV